MDIGIFFLYFLKRTATPSSVSSISHCVPPPRLYSSFHLNKHPQVPLLSKLRKKKAPGGDLCQAWLLMRSIQEREVIGYFGSKHGIKDRGQDGKNHLEINFWSPSIIMQEHQGQFGKSKMKMVLLPFFLFSPPIFFHLNLLCQKQIFILIFCHPCFSLGFTIKYIKCFSSIPFWFPHLSFSV